MILFGVLEWGVKIDSLDQGRSYVDKNVSSQDIPKLMKVVG